jgi:hypothetical protein
VRLVKQIDGEVFGWALRDAEVKLNALIKTTKPVTTTPPDFAAAGSARE